MLTPDFLISDELELPTDLEVSPEFEFETGPSMPYVPIAGREYGPRWKARRPPGLPPSARPASIPGAAMPLVVQAATARNLGDVFLRLMTDLATTESNATFALPANTFDARPQDQRPAGKARITAWGVFQFNRPAWCALRGYGANNCPADTFPWNATPQEEIEQPVKRYAEVFASVKNAGGSELDAARGVRLWQRSPSAEFRRYLQRGSAAANFTAAWQQVDDAHRAAVDARLRQAGILGSQNEGEWELEWESEARFSFAGVPAAVVALLRSRREREAVALAIRQGNRSENHLSDLVFFSRHPERQGRYIQQTEPAYRSVSREWLSIRDTVVRPTLRIPPPAPETPHTPSPGGSDPGPTPPETPPAQTNECRAKTCQLAAATMTLAQYRTEVVRVATEEYERWGSGTVVETDPRIRDVLRSYWQDGANIDPERSYGANWPTAAAWSGAFISWVIRSAGAGNAFCYSSAHGDYMAWAKANREGRTCSPFKLYRSEEVTVEPGDIVCRVRTSDGQPLAPATYETLRPGRGYHCDIVVGVQSSGAGVTRVTTIGGNRSVIGGDPNAGLTVNRFGSDWPGRYFVVIKVA